MKQESREFIRGSVKDWGGCLVKPHWSEEELLEYPDLQNEYDVFYLNTEVGESEDGLFAALCFVDLNDLESDEYRLICDAAGQEDVSYDLKNETPERCAAEWVDFAGLGHFPHESFQARYPSCMEDYFLSKDELTQWLKDLEVPSEIIGCSIEKMAEQARGAISEQPEKDLGGKGVER